MPAPKDPKKYNRWIRRLKARKYSKETRKKLSKAWKGKRNPGHKRKGKTLEKVFGKKKAKKWKEKMSKASAGEKNPMYGKRGKEAPWWGKHHSKKYKIKMSKLLKGVFGENHPSWQGGISFLPYSHEFNKQTKMYIKKRDKYRCRVCYKKEEKPGELQIHHINSNKKDTREINLITLCIGCHGKTKGVNRDYWFAYLCQLLHIKPEELIN